MIQIGVAEARARFSELLRRAAAGERIAITRRGAPMAALVPARHQPKRPVAETVAALREFRGAKRLDGISLAELKGFGSRPTG